MHAIRVYAQVSNTDDDDDEEEESGTLQFSGWWRLVAAGLGLSWLVAAGGSWRRLAAAGGNWWCCAFFMLDTA